MPAQEFRPDSDGGNTGEYVRVTWDFEYQEIYVAIGNRTFQLHSVNELRTTGELPAAAKKSTPCWCPLSIT